MSELPIAPVERMIKKAGAERVSDSAKDALTKCIEEYATEVSKEAVKLAEYANRKTVRAEDIDMAIKRVS